MLCVVVKGAADVGIARSASSSLWAAEISGAPCGHGPASCQVGPHSGTGLSHLLLCQSRQHNSIHVQKSKLLPNVNLWKIIASNEVEISWKTCSQVDASETGGAARQVLISCYGGQSSLAPMKSSTRGQGSGAAVVYVLWLDLSWAQLRVSPVDRPQSEQGSDAARWWEDNPAVCTSLRRVESRLGRWMTCKTALAGILCDIRATWRRKTIDWIFWRPNLAW